MTNLRRGIASEGGEQRDAESVVPLPKVGQERRGPFLAGVKRDSPVPATSDPVVLPAWRHETKRLPPQRARYARLPSVRGRASNRAVEAGKDGGRAVLRGAWRWRD